MGRDVAPKNERPSTFFQNGTSRTGILAWPAGKYCETQDKALLSASK